LRKVAKTSPKRKWDFFTILRTVVIISDQKLAEETGKAFKKDKKLLKGECMSLLLPVDEGVTFEEHFYCVPHPYRYLFRCFKSYFKSWYHYWLFSAVSFFLKSRASVI
jgi:hypothetical protein